MLSEFLDFEAWARWFAALDREFIFLLALPFVVAVIGLWSWFTESEAEARETSMVEPRSAEPALPVQGERRIRARRREDARPVHQA
jgi:hypothetical protein